MLSTVMSVAHLGCLSLWLKPQYIPSRIGEKGCPAVTRSSLEAALFSGALGGPSTRSQHYNGPSSSAFDHCLEG